MVIGLLMGEFDPPTLDHSRAAETLSTLKGIEECWLCPLAHGNEDHVGNMCTIMAASLSSEGKGVAYCGVAIGKDIQSPQGALEACRRLFPYHRFFPALLLPRNGQVQPCDQGLPGGAMKFVFSGEDAFSGSMLPVVLGAKRVGDKRTSIAAGRDESRFFCKPVWEYIVSRGVYSTKPKGERDG